MGSAAHGRARATWPSASAPRPPASTRRSATRAGWRATRRTRWPRARRRCSPAPAARPAPNSRWGDYSDLTVDPVDDCTFWYTNEYYPTTSSFNWRPASGASSSRTAPPARSGTLAGTVTDAEQQQPDRRRHGGRVHRRHLRHHHRPMPAATTHEPAGRDSYNVTYSAFGYGTRHRVQRPDHGRQHDTKNVALTTQPTVTVSGTVKDGSGHGWPLYARIDVAGDPAAPFFTDPVTGHYSIQLPANATYAVTFTSKIPGYQSNQQTIVVGGPDMTQNVRFRSTPDCTAPGYKQDDSASRENFDEEQQLPAGWLDRHGPAGQRSDLAAQRPGGPAEQDRRHGQLRRHQLRLLRARQLPGHVARHTDAQHVRCFRAVPDVPQQLLRLPAVPADRRRGREHGRRHHVDERLARTAATRFRVPTWRPSSYRRPPTRATCSCASTSRARSASGGRSTTSPCTTARAA